MATTITAGSTYWTITRSDGRAAAAPKNQASATLLVDGTVIIESERGDTLWSEDIMTIGGLVGATPLLRLTDLLNNYLTGLSSSLYNLATVRYTFNGVQPTWTTGDPNLIIPFDTLQYSGGATIASLTSPGVVEIQIAGLYLVSANVTAERIAGATATDMVPVIIARNGVQDGGRFRATTNNAERFTLFGTNVLQCAVGDTVSFILPNYTAPPATTYTILNSTNSSGCALNLIKL